MTIAYLSKANIEKCTGKDIGNLVATKFSKTSINNYTSTFQKCKNTAKKINLQFKQHRNTRNYSIYQSLTKDREKSKTTTDADDVYYQFIKHLESCLSFFLYSSKSTICHTGKFLKSWLEYIYLSVNLTKTNATNYRPIALTNCVCKIIETIINT